MEQFESGVYPGHLVKFTIQTGKTPETFAVIADCEGVTVDIDGNVEEWNPMDQGGWSRRLKTGSSLTIGLTAKRNVGDAGNDYVASKALAMGSESNSVAKVVFPDGSTLTMPCVINVTNMGTGETRDVAPLEFELQSDGKPTYVPGV